MRAPTVSIKSLLASLPLLLAACGGSVADMPADGGTEPLPTVTTAGFKVTIGPAALAAGQGQEAWLEVNLARDPGFVDPVRLSLTPEAGIAADSVLLAPSQSRGVLPIRVAADLAAGSVHRLEVTAVGTAASRSATSTLTVTAPQLASQQLIAAARAANTIDDGTALLYRVYALLGDQRLPDDYLGAGSLEEDNGLFVEIGRRLAGLPAEKQAALRPFNVRPADAQSVWNAVPVVSAARATTMSIRSLAISPAVCPAGPAASGVWISKRSARYAVRVWAQCTGIAAENVDAVAVIDAGLAVLDQVYVSMTALMGPPLPDLEGGDNAIDFYLVNNDGYVHRRDGDWRPRGLATTFNDPAEAPVAGSPANSAFVTMPRSVAYGSRFHNTLIHEFFHVLQKAHNADFAFDASGKGHWFVEASATWASAYFDRTAGPWTDGRGAWLDVYRRFKEVFQKNELPLNASVDRHDYSAFIWPYFVEQETGGPAFMGAIWSALERVTTFDEADHAIDRAYPFATSFKRFAMRNLNREFLPGDPLPRAKRYVALDPEQFTDDNVPPDQIVAGTLVADRAYVQNLSLENLSARYLHLTVAGDVAPPVRKIKIDTTQLQAAGTVDIQALLLTQEGWLPQPLDITDNTATFCFDAGPATVNVRGSFQQIVFVVSNHVVAPDTNVVGDLRIEPSSQPCATVWDGSVDMTATVDASNSLTTAVFSHASTAKVTFEIDPTSTAPLRPFRLRAGSYVYREVREIADIGSCHTVVTSEGALHRALSDTDRSDGAATGTLSTFESPVAPLPQYALGETIEIFSAFGTSTEVHTCTLSGSGTSMLPAQTFLLWQAHGNYDITAGGTEMRGTYSFDNGGGTTTYKWLLTKKSE